MDFLWKIMERSDFVELINDNEEHICTLNFSFQPAYICDVYFKSTDLAFATAYVP